MKLFALILLSLNLISLSFSNKLFADNPENSKEKIKILSSLPRTGSANAQTNSIVNGIKMAVEEANKSSQKFQYLYEDLDDASPERGAWDPALEAANADKAIRDPEVMAYMGPFNSGAAKISMPKLNQAGILMVNCSNTWAGLTKPGLGEANEPTIYRPSGQVSYFRVVPSDEIQGSAAANWARQLGAKKVVILHDRELYGKGIAEKFKAAAEVIPQKSGSTQNVTAEKLEVLLYEGIDTKASNYKSLAIKIKQLSPDLIFFGGTTQSNAGQLVKDLRNSGLKTKYMVPDGCMETAFIDAAGKDNVEGNTYITFCGMPASKLEGKGKEFVSAYLKKYNIEPEAYAAYSYEAAKVAISAIEKAGKKDRQAILDAARNLGQYDGVLGKWSFDKNGDTSLTTVSGNIVKSGKFEFVQLLE